METVWRLCMKREWSERCEKYAYDAKSENGKMDGTDMGR